MIVLASQSKIRRDLLTAAGVPFTAATSPLDEEKLHHELKHLSPRDLAIALAEAKAAAFEPQNPNDTIIGVDQVFAMDNQILHKPNSLEEAKQHLNRLNGNIHQLHTAYSIIHNAKHIAQHCETSTLTMRNLSAAFINTYIESTSEAILTSVGCYQLEGLGIQLMKDFQGDYFSILGLPLLPLLNHLRELGEIPT